jgi:signal transduction histidine kinase
MTTIGHWRLANTHELMDAPPIRKRSTPMQTRSAAIATVRKRPAIVLEAAVRKSGGTARRTLHDHIERLETLLAASGRIVWNLSAEGLRNAAAWRTLTGQSGTTISGGWRPEAIWAGQPPAARHEEKLLSLAQATASETNEVARHLAELARDALACEGVGLLIVDPQTQHLRPLAIVGYTAERGVDADWPYDTVLLEAEIRDAATRLQAGEVVEFDMSQPPLNAFPNLYGAVGGLVAPLRVREHLLGILVADYGDTGHAPGPREHALAAAVAQYAALVIEHERVLREREQAQANEIAQQEINQRMREFLGTAGHEMRSPLTSLKGNVQILERRLRRAAQAGSEEPDAAAARHGQRELVGTYLERMERQVNRVSRLVDDLIDASQVQMGRLQLRLAPCDLVTVVRDAVAEERQLHPHRTIQLTLPAAGSLPLTADSDRLVQVVVNYITNALKYSREDRPVAATLATKDGVARVAVRDRGPGLPPTERKRVWEPFYSGSTSTRSTGPHVGLGLGLHICKTIIELHGGQVGLQSRVGRGSTFWFTLPLQPHSR